ncbi:MAG: dihydrofolate reductase family protein [Candidatus Dormibacteria bacterium]
MLREIYGSDLALKPTALYANFVQSIDGVVALPGVESSGSALSAKNAADRFVMALLRASASAVLIGAGTLRDSPGHHWTAEHIFPQLAEEFIEARATLGLAPRPRLVVVSAGGAVDVNHPAIRAGATFLTTRAGAERLKPAMPGSCDVRTWDQERVPMAEALGWLRELGHARILSEAGPKIMGQLVAERLLDDLFVTVSPVLAGRDGGGRPGLVEGVEVLPQRRLEARLAGARQSGDYLLMRYSLR